MRDVKRGYIVQILKQDGIGIIREDETLTEWIFFLGDLDRRWSGTIQVSNLVTFRRDFSSEQPVAKTVEVVHRNVYRAG